MYLLSVIFTPTLFVYTFLHLSFNFNVFVYVPLKLQFDIITFVSSVITTPECETVLTVHTQVKCKSFALMFCLFVSPQCS